MRLRTEAIQALARAPIQTLRGLRTYARAGEDVRRLLSCSGLDDALAALDRTRVVERSTVSPTLVMRLGESLWRGRRTCLDRALTRYAFLQAAGSSPTFVIGLDRHLVASHDAEALGHAWVEVQGEPWPSEDVARYHVSFRHPNPARAHAHVETQ